MTLRYDVGSLEDGSVPRRLICYECFQSLKRLMEAFGPLEFMMPFDPKVHQSDGGTDLDPSITGATTDINGDDPETFHPQEQLDSSSELSRTLDSTDNEYEGIWAVKWEHRNDAVSAVTVGPCSYTHDL